MLFKYGTSRALPVKCIAVFYSYHVCKHTASFLTNKNSDDVCSLETLLFCLEILFIFSFRYGEKKSVSRVLFISHVVLPSILLHWESGNLFNSNLRKIIRNFVDQYTVLECYWLFSWETSTHLFYSESLIINVISHCIIQKKYVRRKTETVLIISMFMLYKMLTNKSSHDASSLEVISTVAILFKAWPKV